MLKFINIWGFVFFSFPLRFVNSSVTSDQAAKIGAESSKCLIKSLIYQEMTVKFKLCVIQGELGGQDACECGGFSLSVTV